MCTLHDTISQTFIQEKGQKETAFFTYSETTGPRKLFLFLHVRKMNFPSQPDKLRHVMQDFEVVSLLLTLTGAVFTVFKLYEWVLIYACKKCKRHHRVLS